MLAVAAQLPRTSRLRAILVLVGLIGMAGNVAYGFDTIHTSFGDVRLVDRGGAANLIKPLDLFFPLSLLPVRAACAGSATAGRRRQCWRGVAWPIEGSPRWQPRGKARDEGAACGDGEPAAEQRGDVVGDEVRRWREAKEAPPGGGASP